VSSSDKGDCAAAKNAAEAWSEQGERNERASPGGGLGLRGHDKVVIGERNASGSTLGGITEVSGEGEQGLPAHGCFLGATTSQQVELSTDERRRLLDYFGRLHEFAMSGSHPPSTQALWCRHRTQGGAIDPHALDHRDFRIGRHAAFVVMQLRHHGIHGGTAELFVFRLMRSWLACSHSKAL
jgi:hypothetical protein